MTNSKSDIFMVFVEGKAGVEDAYAEWFGGSHMTDMENLPGVGSANAFRMSALDGGTCPTELCALYETDNGGQLLRTIGKSKGTDALPHSELQGQMTWRMLQTLDRSGPGGLADPKASVLICMFAGEWDAEAESRLWAWLGDCDLPIIEARQTQISPVQPSRGREFEGILLLTLPADADVAAIAAAVKDQRNAASSLILLANPI
ncbi:MAG: hypothetical protein KUG65_08965 [Sphingomonadaceae bacterium]|nr:hypothetical protein [Sphingomonadaceae bacterium]